MNDLSSSRSIAIRSLRRRLWRALQEENVDTAIRAYTATRADYQAWIMEEKQAQEERDKQARLVAQQEGKNKPFSKIMRKRNSKKDVISVEAPNLDHWDDQDYLLIAEMDPSSNFVADDFLSPDAPYDTPSSDIAMDGRKNTVATTKRTSNRRKNRGPRFAGAFWMMRRQAESSDDDDEDEVGDEVDNVQTTTPLHEAARLGSAQLVRLFLQHGGLPNVKNGMQRTALHMAAGGLSVEEANLVVARAATQQQQESPESKVQEIGIRAPLLDTQESNDEDDSEEHPAAVGAKKALRRLFALGNTADKSVENDLEKPTRPPPFDEARYNEVAAKRMDAVLAILSWCHADDGSPCANEGPSINSVDARGRTALHYAAELGRADICLAVVSSFGAILTIVDESSQTPCELAGEQSYCDLAAQLEARAVLYSDPYGVDDELMASVLLEEQDNGENDDDDDPSRDRKKLAVPFSWFETLSPVQVRQERNSRTEKAMMEMQRILAERVEQEKANAVMFNYDVNDSLDSAPQVDIEQELLGDEQATETMEIFDEPIHMLAEIDDDHPPSPPSERASETETTKTKVTIEAEAITQGEAETTEPEVTIEAAATMQDATEEVSRKDTAATKPPVFESEYTLLLDALQESHVEQYLAYHQWDSEKATTSFSKDPVDALIDADVSVSTKKASLKWEELEPQTCLICFEEFDAGSSEWRSFRRCDHGFCSQCLSDYVVDCAQSRGGGITVTCPHHECNVPLTQNELQSFVPNPSVYESLLEAADENFCASSSDLKFCPHPGCEGVVRRLVPPLVSQEGFDEDIIDTAGAVCVSFPEGGSEAPLTYEGVRDERYKMTKGALQPHVAHRFCFGCGDSTIHWPVPCDTLEQWKTKVRDEISEIDEEEGGGQNGNFEDVAQKLWIKANTRPCPRCKAPIEKQEGCNHMTCTNRHCRHEFCWICRKDWKLHNSETGGFFRCNRWEGEADHEFYDGEEHQPPPRPTDGSEEGGDTNDNGYGSALHSSRVAYKKANEMKRFLHHFSRWSAHKESSDLERNMANTVGTRLAPVVEAAVEFNGAKDFDFAGKGTCSRVLGRYRSPRRIAHTITFQDCLLFMPRLRSCLSAVPFFNTAMHLHSFDIRHCIIFDGIGLSSCDNVRRPHSRSFSQSSKC